MHIFRPLDLVTLPFGAHAQNSPRWALLPQAQQGVEHEPLVVTLGHGALVLAALSILA